MTNNLKYVKKNRKILVNNAHENYDYLPRKATESKYNRRIKELADPQERVRLLESLERGNRQAVTFVGNGDQKRFIEANPQFKSVTVYDENQKRIRQSGTENEQISVTQAKKKTNQQLNKEPSSEEEKSESAVRNAASRYDESRSPNLRFRMPNRLLCADTKRSQNRPISHCALPDDLEGIDFFGKSRPPGYL